MDKLNNLWLQEYASKTSRDSYLQTSYQSQKAIRVLERHLRSRIFPYIKTNSHVLDVGCNTGFFTSQLAQYSQKVVGVDYCPELIEIAKKNYPTIEFQQQNIYNHDLEPTTFDIIICYGLLQNLEYPKKAIHKMIELLSLKNESILNIITLPSYSLLNNPLCTKLCTYLFNFSPSPKLLKFEPTFFIEIAQELKMRTNIVYRSALVPGHSQWISTHLCVEFIRS